MPLQKCKTKYQLFIKKKKKKWEMWKVTYAWEQLSYLWS